MILKLYIPVLLLDRDNIFQLKQLIINLQNVVSPEWPVFKFVIEPAGQVVFHVFVNSSQRQREGGNCIHISTQINTFFEYF